MLSLSRRTLLRQSGALALGFLGLKRHGLGQGADASVNPYGELLKDPAGLLDLPQGFRYVAFSRVGERMDDGFFVPGLHDGMAAFEGPDGLTILVRNHEMGEGNPNQGPYAGNEQLFRGLDRRFIYDAGNGSRPALGGTTTLLYDTNAQRLVKHALTLTGTIRNCAGGPTPWGTWMTCEETNLRRGSNATLEADHGYNFDVPILEMTLVEPRPLKAMGRFSHEAIAVDPRSWIVFQTEDRSDSLIYRFVPARVGDMSRGRLQALVVRDAPGLDTRNPSSATSPMPVGEAFDCTWVDIEDVESPQDNLRAQGFAKGAARFARGEGMWASPEAIWFVCTSGGRAGKGQVFRYVPSAYEGRREERRYPGRLELFFEPNDQSVIDNPDNVCVAPWGDLVLVEDGPAPNQAVIVTPEGEAYPLARVSQGSSELAGACFSPDGGTLFMNIQGSGVTVAITGPWQTARA